MNLHFSTIKSIFLGSQVTKGGKTDRGRGGNTAAKRLISFHMKSKPRQGPKRPRLMDDLRGKLSKEKDLKVVNTKKSRGSGGTVSDRGALSNGMADEKRGTKVYNFNNCSNLNFN